MWQMTARIGVLRAIERDEIRKRAKGVLCLELQVKERSVFCERMLVRYRYLYGIDRTNEAFNASDCHSRSSHAQ